MTRLEKRIKNLTEQIQDCKQQLKSQLLIDDDCEYQEQLELRWHIGDLEDELNDLLEENRAEEEIEGWG